VTFEILFYINLIIFAGKLHYISEKKKHPIIKKYTFIEVNILLVKKITR